MTINAPRGWDWFVFGLGCVALVVVMLVVHVAARAGLL